MTLPVFLLLPYTSNAQLSVLLKVSATGTVGNIVNTNIDSNVEVKTNPNTNSEININAGVGIDLENNSSDKAMKVNASGVAIMLSSQVNSEADLKVFSSNASTKNKSVVKININSKDDGESKVEVIYRHNGKLFGFIPITVRSTTILEVTANGETEIKTGKSWYAFLVTGENYTGADVKSRIKNDVIIKSNAKANASALEKAKIAEAIITELSTNAQIKVSTNK